MERGEDDFAGDPGEAFEGFAQNCDTGEGGDAASGASEPSESASPGDRQPAKLPTPRRPVRHNEWTREKMVTFLRELAATQCVTRAAKAVGMSRTSAYRLRNRLRSTPFDLGWEVALEMGFHQLAHAVMDRALNGVEEQRFYHGELVGTVRKYDNALARWVLENPWRVGRAQVAREYSAEGFDRLLERIEFASLDWEEGEAVPGRSVDLGAEDHEAREAESAFLGKQSWYASESERQRLRGPGRG